MGKEDEGRELKEKEVESRRTVSFVWSPCCRKFSTSWNYNMECKVAKIG